MPKYTVILSKKAQKQLDKLSDNIAQPIFETISQLEITQNLQATKNLKDALGIEFGRVTIG